MSGKVIFWSVTVALGGFLFGFDTAVISGAEQAIQQHWNLSEAEHGLAVAIALYGTVLGALFGSFPADKWGRKPALIGVGLLYLVSAVGSALAPDVNTFMLFRFLGGVGVGASSVAAPMYISEIAPPDKRGRLASLFQFNIVSGILIAYLSNFLLAGVGSNSWRWMLGVEAFPALLFTILMLYVPRSPRWLLSVRGDRAAALEILSTISVETAHEALSLMEENIEKSGRDTKLFVWRFRFPVSLAVILAVFNQISGINAIIYYAPRIFQMTGLGESSALLSSAGVGLVNLIATIIGISLIDSKGRRALMIIGSVGLITSLGFVSRAFFTEQFNGVPAFVFLFIASFAVSQGCVLWVFLSEIFPNSVRAKGQSLGSFTHWICAALVAHFFPLAATQLGGGAVFAFFGTAMICQLVYVLMVMPETKGVPLEELQRQILGEELDVKQTDP
ncbi:MAG TPA: MFS transporter [Phycisphaerales bacterium]|nr:MFS transporter [Phycisphaerales bacterium]